MLGSKPFQIWSGAARPHNSRFRVLAGRARGRLETGRSGGGSRLGAGRNPMNTGSPLRPVASVKATARVLREKSSLGA